MFISFNNAYINLYNQIDRIKNAEKDCLLRKGCIFADRKWAIIYRGVA